ncbi:MAG: hypothetical protein WDM77_14735 [Steroidobacteraceae bacterium]
MINTIFGVEAVLALFKLLGWTDPGGVGKLLAVTSAAAAVWGASRCWAMRPWCGSSGFFAVVVGVALLMVMGYTLPQVNWAHAALAHAPLSGSSTLAVFLVAAGIIASNPISFLFNGA